MRFRVGLRFRSEGWDAVQGRVAVQGSGPGCGSGQWAGMPFRAVGRDAVQGSGSQCGFMAVGRDTVQGRTVSRFGV